jgi:N-acetylneuraminic acid mutarotase
MAPLVEKLPAEPADGALNEAAAGAAIGAEDLTTPAPESCRNIDEWSTLSTQNAPSPRYAHTAVWTGAEMIVWGGRFPATGIGLATGANYDPLTDSWNATSLSNAPAGRYLHTAVWTGSEMVIWGGNPGLLQTGARYDPVADGWTPTTTSGAPQGRDDHTAVWTGSEMIVWGGSGSLATGLATGGRYDPLADRWRPTSMFGAPTGRFWHTSAWTGDEMIVWGGTFSSNAVPMDSGGRYDPSSDTWRDTALTNAPSPRVFASAVWTGREMIVWGGSLLDSGGIYDPVLDAWRPISTVEAPAGRAGHSALWTDRLMVVWGGNIPVTSPVNTGGMYDPVIDVWTPVSTDNAPTARSWHTAVLASSEMIVWGGYDGITLLGSGAGYGVDVSPDADGDGVTICEGDCDDTDPQVGGGPELPGNRKDENCDGIVLCDPGAGWKNPGEFRLCVERACADLERRGLVTPPQCRRRIAPIPS